MFSQMKMNYILNDDIQIWMFVCKYSDVTVCFLDVRILHTAGPKPLQNQESPHLEFVESSADIGQTSCAANGFRLEQNLETLA